MLGSPANRGPGAEETAFELLQAVLNLRRRKSAVPFHVEGHLGANRENTHDGRTGNPQPLRQRVGKVVVVENIQVAHAEASSLVVEVNLDGIVPYRDHPKHVVAVNVHVVVVNLSGQSNWTGVHVKSNKGESASMLAAVGTDEFALTETHVCLKSQPRGGTRRVSSGPAAPYVR